MDFELSENQKMLKQSLREVLVKEFPKQYFREKDAKREWPTEVVTKLGELGYLGIPIPVEYGGTGGSTLDSVIVQEELSRTIGGSALFWILSCSFGAKTISKFGNEKQKKEILPKLAKGQLVMSMALTEPSGGTDILAMSTRANPDGKGKWIINGQKTFITGAHVADWLIVVAKTGDVSSRKAFGFTQFLLSPKAPGIEISKIEIGAQRTTGANDIFFNDVLASEEDVIGQVDKGFFQLFATLNNERMCCAAHYLSVAAAAYDIALQFAKDRQAFGGPIGRFQAIQHKLADSYIKIEAARNYIYKVAWMDQEGMSTQTEGSACLRYATDTAMQVAQNCFRVLGGYAVCSEYDLNRYFRDSILGVAGPISNEMCLNQVAEALGLPRSY